jgi:hypothetical protein
MHDHPYWQIEIHASSLRRLLAAACDYLLLFSLQIGELTFQFCCYQLPANHLVKRPHFRFHHSVRWHESLNKREREREGEEIGAKRAFMYTYLPIS